MELFRMIKGDARRAMRFCGGRAVASLMIISLAHLSVSLTETLLLFLFFGSESIYYDFYRLWSSFGSRRKDFNNSCIYVS